jgi:hypothetical protein
MRRDLAGRAVLIAAGVGTALGAGAGLANAAPLEQDLQQDQAGQNAFDQSAPTDALTGSLPAAPNLGLSDGTMKTQAASPLDVAPVSGGQLAGLGTSDLLGGLGSNGGTDKATEASDSAQSADSTEAADSAAPATTGDSTSGSTSGSSSDSTAPSSSSGESPAASSGDGGYTSSYGS